MPYMTTEDIVGRISSMLASPPFGFTEAPEPFDLKYEAANVTDGSFCILAELDDFTAYLGVGQAEIDRLSIRLARKFSGDPHATVQLLYDDVNSLWSAIVHDVADYNGEIGNWNVPPPPDNVDYVVAQIEVLVDFDRAL